MSRAWNPESKVIRCAAASSAGSPVYTDLLQVTTSTAYLVQGIYVSTSSSPAIGTWNDYSLVYRYTPQSLVYPMMIFNGPAGQTDTISDKTPYEQYIPGGSTQTSVASNYARVIVSKDNAFFHSTLDWRLSIANENTWTLDVLITYVAFKGTTNVSNSGVLWTY
jgi:hypothetical protein